MQKDYCEILLTAIDMMQQSAELSRATITSDVQVNVDIDKLLPSANPLEDMLQHEAATYQHDITLAAGEATMMFTWMLHSQSRYDRLGIKTLITTDKQATQGSYGIQLTVYSSSKVYTVQLDSSDMLGDIFNFSDMLQKKIFDLTGASNIQAIKIQCYNNTNGTVTFSNTQVAIGYLLEQYGPNSEPLVLYVDGDDKKETNLTYTTSGGEVIENSEITLCVRWIYQDGVSYRAVTHHNFEDFPKGCSIRWYRYTPDNSGGDQYGGSYWQYIPLGVSENPFKRTLSGFDPAAENEQFKVVVLQGSLAGGIAATSSNIVKITNIISGAVEILTNRKILFDDGTNGIYPWYAFDDILAEDYLYEATTKRTLHLSYNSKLSNDDTLQKIQKITWKLPSEFMYYIADTSDEVVEEDGYTIITHNYENTKKPESLDSIFITYTIACEIAGVATAKVQCIFTMDDNIEYIFEHEINFSHTLGGTDNSVIVRLLDASGEIHSAIDINNTIEYHVFPTVYNIDGTPIEGATYNAQLIITDFTEDDIKEKMPPAFKGDNGTDFILPKEAGLFSLKSLAFIKFIFTIPKGSASDDEDMKFKGELQIEEWFGLPITALGSYVYKGPKRIVYNSSGVDPQYNKTNLQVVNDNSATQTWTAVGCGKYNKNAEGPEKIEDYFKTHNKLFPIVKGNIIRPCHAFDKIIGTGISYFGVCCTGKWLQPIVIYQNRYFSRILNDWDGSLQIDEDGNYILSSAYVAGGKDEQNTFTGLVMGELGTISDEISDKKLNSTETGLFGYNKGAQSFGFRTNGSAFLGESGGGRINFDGNQGIIYSGNFDGFPKIKDEEGNEGAENDTSVSSENVSIGTQGTYLNLKDGLFITSNGNFRGSINSNDIIIGEAKEGAYIRLGFISESVFSQFEFYIINDEGQYERALEYSENATYYYKEPNKNNNIVFNDAYEYIQSDNYDNSGNSIEGFKLDFKNATIDSKYFTLNNAGGVIGGWTIGEAGLFQGKNIKNANLYLGSGITIDKNTYVFKAGDNFKVTSDGVLQATNANISGALQVGTGGAIANWKVGTLESYNPDAIWDSAFHSSLYAGYEGETVNRYLILRAAATASHIAFGVLIEDINDNKEYRIYDEKGSIRKRDAFYIKNDGTLGQEFLTEFNQDNKSPYSGQYWHDKTWNIVNIRDGSIKQTQQKIIYDKDAESKTIEETSSESKAGGLYLSASKIYNTFEEDNKNWSAKDPDTNDFSIATAHYNPSVSTYSTAFYKFSGNGIWISPDRVGSKEGGGQVMITSAKSYGDNNVPKLTMTEDIGTFKGTWRIQTPFILNNWQISTISKATLGENIANKENSKIFWLNMGKYSWTNDYLDLALPMGYICQVDNQKYEILPCLRLNKNSADAECTFYVQATKISKKE